MRKEGKKVPSLFPKNAFFYTVIVHNVLTIVNNCCMLSFFSEQISIYLTNNSFIFVSLLIGIRANNFFIKTALIDIIKRATKILLLLVK